MPTREELRKYYAQLPDEKILCLALNESGDLTAEAVEVLRVEIQNRQISAEARNAIDVQLKALGEGEIEGLIQWFRASPCPLCRRQGSPLNAFQTITVTSYLVATTKSASVIVGCADCIKKAAREAQSTTVLAGWWGLPWGPIYTLDAISTNASAMKAKDLDAPTDDFKDFVRRNARVLVAQRAQEK